MGNGERAFRKREGGGAGAGSGEAAVGVAAPGGGGNVRIDGARLAGVAEAPVYGLTQRNTRSRAAVVAASSFAPGARIAELESAPRRRSTSLRIAMPMPS